MYTTTKSLLVALLVAYVEARFGQEQIPISAIGAVTSGGGPGVAATLAGSAISTLLAAANPCAKLQKADEIIDQLGTGADAVAAAIGLVAAEQNFNPFVVSIPSICSDPSLPKSAVLRGVVPLIDPAVEGSALENANSAKSVKSPFAASGLSVADVMAAQGFTNFTTKALDGTVGAAPAGGNGGGNAADNTAGNNAGNTADGGAAAGGAAAGGAAAADCPPATVTVTQTVDAAATTLATAVKTTAAAATEAAQGNNNAAPAAGTTDLGAAGVAPAFVKSSLGLDFGTCVPTLKFEAALNNRKATEFTFQAQDPVVNKGQQEALNPAIIMNRICDQLGNVCGAAADAKAACQAAKTKLGGGPRDVTTADLWNSELGFAGAETNPDGAPKAGLIGHT